MKHNIKQNIKWFDGLKLNIHPSALNPQPLDFKTNALKRLLQLSRLERQFRDPEVVGSTRSLEVFSNWSRFDIHLMTTSVNAKYYLHVFQIYLNNLPVLSPHTIGYQTFDNASHKLLNIHLIYTEYHFYKHLDRALRTKNVQHSLFVFKKQLIYSESPPKNNNSTI